MDINRYSWVPTYLWGFSNTSTCVDMGQGMGAVPIHRGGIALKKKSLFEESELELEEAKRAWELGKNLELSATNEIDVTWVLVKEQRSKKGKKIQASRGKNRRRKRGKENF